MTGVVQNKTLAYERAYSEIKRHSSAGEPDFGRAEVSLLARAAPYVGAGLKAATLGHPSETVVVIAPSEPAEVAWLNVSSYGLTPREEVVRLVARGRSTREVSGALFISEHAVHNHMRSIFAKTGVHSRGEMVRRIFFEDVLRDVLGD